MVIAVSGLNSNDNPGPGVGIAKSLCSEFDIVGFSYDINETGNYLPYIKKSFLMPYPTLGFEPLYNRLKEIKKATNLDIIIPALDAEYPLYLKYKKEIEELGIKIILPTKESFEFRNKNKLDELSQKLNVAYPKTIAINSIDELYKAMNKFSYPVMIKGNFYKAYKAYNFDSAIEYFYKISNEWGFPILIQEVVSGEEINLVGVGDGKELVGALSIKKLAITDIGKVWTAVTIEHKKLLNLAKDFVKKTNWFGAFELECIANHDEIIIIEINPRFPAWVYFATELGINLPKMVVDLALDKKINPKFEYEIGKMYLRFVEEKVIDFSKVTSFLSKKEI